MLEGLEISEINFQTALKLNKDGRLDSHFYQRIFIEMRHLAKKWPSLQSISSKIECGPFGSNLLNTNYGDSGIPMIRPFNLRRCRSDHGDIALLSEGFVDNASLSTFAKNTVFFARVGDMGVGANVYKQATISPNIIAATVPDEVYAKFISVFASTKYGNIQLDAEVKAVAQPTISTETVRAFKVPIISANFRRQISELYSKSEAKLQSSTKLTIAAEQILLAALGLNGWQPPNPLTYEAHASEAFQSDRLDAEFFRPQFDALEKKLKQTGSAVRLGDVAALISRGGQPTYTDDGLPVINSKHVNHGRVVSNDDNRRGEADGKSLLIQQGDVLINGTGVGTIGRSAPYLDEQDALPDNHVTIVRAKEGAIDPVYLAIFLNSKAGQMQVDKWFKGSSGQIELYPDDISNFWVWVAPKKLQKSIRDQVMESRTALTHSKSLLERAKRAVEIAIEESEEVALAYLDGKHYLADELLPKLFSPNRHYIDLPTIQRTIEAEALVYEATTINRYLHEWTREGRIHDAGRGWYSNLRHVFHSNLQTPPLPELEKLLKKKFPLLEFTVWSTHQLSTFFHHYPARQATFLMVDRDAMETVADVLLKAGHHVVIHPLGDAAKNFALTHEETIILRPRLSSDHKEIYAPIEQMLVDLHHEIQKLGLFDLAEYQSVFENIANRYRLNIPALKRYAERRKTDSLELLKLGGII